MKEKCFLFAFIFLTVIPIVSLAHCPVPGDSHPCNGDINITELILYIGQWYKCSLCVQDLGDAMNAYFKIPFCGDMKCNGNEDCNSCPQDGCECITDPNLIAWWTFDDVDGDIVIDRIGGHNGTIEGNAKQSEYGYLGKSFDFFGTGDAIQISRMEEPIIPEGSNFSICVWFYGTNDMPRNAIYSYMDGISQSPYFIEVVSKRVYLYLGNSVTITVLELEKDLESNNWYHLCYTFDGTNMRGYIESELINSKDVLGVLSGTYPKAGGSNTDEVIGSIFSGSTRNWVGSLDDLKLFDKALNQDEVIDVFREAEAYAVCGNGQTQPGEQCDLRDNNKDKPESGCYGKETFCNMTCQLETQNCDRYCGDSQVTDTEVCEFGNMNGETCETKGFYTGNLACSDDCQTFNTLNCDYAAWCSNGDKDHDEDGIDCGGANCPPCVSSISLDSRITWTFDTGYRVGQFINGDYWVVGPVTVSSIYPAPENKSIVKQMSCTEHSDCKQYVTSCTATNKCRYTRVYGQDFYPTDFILEDYFPEIKETGEDCTPGYSEENCTSYSNKLRFYTEYCRDNTCVFERVRHGSVVDPIPSQQGYDTKASSCWDAHYTEVLPVFCGYISWYNISQTVYGNEYIEPDSSLVSTISIPLGFPNKIRSADVLTVLEKVPPQDAFRPPYIKGEKTIFRWSDVNLDLLPDLPKPNDGIQTNNLKAVYQTDKHFPDVAILAQNFSRVWLDHIGSLGGRYQQIRPIDNMVSYSAYSTILVQRAAAVLMVDNPKDDMPLLRNLLQVGIDYFGISRIDDCLYPAGDGQGNGRKFPVIFAGIMFNNNEMKNKDICSEEGHTYYYNDIGLEEKDAWNFTKRNQLGFTGHKVLFGATAERRGTDSRDYMHVNPQNWSKIRPGTDLGGCRSDGYRTCCNSHYWPGQALALRLLERKTPSTNAMDYFNQSWFDYVDRWMTETYTEDQLFYFKDVPCDLSNPNDLRTFFSDGYISKKGVYWDEPKRTAFDTFIDAMWDTYREDCTDIGGCLKAICQDGECNGFENSMNCPQDCGY